MPEEHPVDGKIAPPPDATSTPPPPPSKPPDLGLALSGGGVRAALFSLGVVLGLIETGCYRRVGCVASVSGGSILNAALAHAQGQNDYSSVDDFKPLASRVGLLLAEQGTFAFSFHSIRRGLWFCGQVGGRVLAAIPSAAIALGIVAEALQKDWNFNLNGFLVRAYQSIPWVPTLAVVAVFLVWWMVSRRGLFQEAIYRDVVKAAIASRNDDVEVTPNLENWGAPAEKPSAEKPSSSRMHVIVATDLLSGMPMYFSGQFVHCNSYGWGFPTGIETTEALYSSAAFPVVFPPKKLKIKKLNFSAGTWQGTLPKKVRLADGGVYNNLGTDWFDVLRDELERASGNPPKVRPFGGLNVSRPLKITSEKLIVVNAGAPSQSVRRLLPGLLSISRIMSVLYDNTVRPRVKGLRHDRRPLIDIQESPLELAERLKEVPEEAGSRAGTLAKRIEQEWPRKFWEDYKKDTAGTATKLSKARLRPGVRLMFQGYLSSLVVAHVMFDAPLPERFWDEGDLLDLIRSSPKPAAGLSTSPTTDDAPQPHFRRA